MAIPAGSRSEAGPGLPPGARPLLNPVSVGPADRCSPGFPGFSRRSERVRAGDRNTTTIATSATNVVPSTAASVCDPRRQPVGLRVAGRREVHIAMMDAEHHQVRPQPQVALKSVRRRPKTPGNGGSYTRQRLPVARATQLSIAA